MNAWSTSLRAHGRTKQRPDYVRHEICKPVPSVTETYRRITLMLYERKEEGVGLLQILCRCHSIAQVLTTQFPTSIHTHSWLGGSVVERRSLTGELSLVCTGPAADW